MEKESEEKKALHQIKEIEEEIQKRLDLAKEKAKKILEAAQEEAEALIKEKESELEEMRQSLLQNQIPVPEETEDKKETPIPSPTPLIRELGHELFQLIIQPPSKGKK